MTTQHAMAARGRLSTVGRRVKMGATRPRRPPGRHEGATVVERCRREIEELHAFFEAWFAREACGDAPSLDRVQRALAPGFALVTPEGRLVERGPLLEGLELARATRPGLRLWTRAWDVRHAWPGGTLATYEEWQEERGRRRGRLSTAVFLADERAPLGVAWRHVHETWLPGGAA